MNINKMKLYTGALAILLLLPNLSLAYFTTSQSATRLTENTVLYTVTYRFGFAERELYMPIMAVRGIQAPTSSPFMGYQIMNNDDTVSTIGVSNSIVLSKDKDVQIKSGQYYLPPQKSAEFTLVTLLTIPPEQKTEDLDLSLLVTNLPFTMVDNGTPIPAHLNPSELQYYHTPSINFGDSGIKISGAVHTLSTK